MGVFCSITKILFNYGIMFHNMVVENSNEILFIDYSYHLFICILKYVLTILIIAEIKVNIQMAVVLKASKLYKKLGK